MRQSKKIQETTTNKREYKLAKFFSGDSYDECYGCQRNRSKHRGKRGIHKRRGCHMKICNPTRFSRRNWKEFRKFQWKEKKVIIYNKVDMYGG